jgi:hypothetical protein
VAILGERDIDDELFYKIYSSYFDGFFELALLIREFEY